MIAIVLPSIATVSHKSGNIMVSKAVVAGSARMSVSLVAVYVLYGNENRKHFYEDYMSGLSNKYKLLCKKLLNIYLMQHLFS